MISEFRTFGLKKQRNAEELEYPPNGYFKTFRLKDKLIIQATYDNLYPYIIEGIELNERYNLINELKPLGIRSLLFPGAFGNEKRQAYYRRVGAEILPSPIFMPTRSKDYDFDKERVVNKMLLDMNSAEVFLCSSLSSLPVLISLMDIPNTKRGCFISPCIGKKSLTMLMRTIAHTYSVLNKLGVDEYRGAEIKSLKHYLMQEKLKGDILEIKKDMITHHNLSAILYHIDPMIKTGYVKDVMDKLGVNTIYYDGLVGHGMRTVTSVMNRDLDQNFIEYVKNSLEELV